MPSGLLWQRGEGLLVFASALAFYGFSQADFPLWLAVLLFFAPDLSMAFYALGPRLGALGYNLAHLYATGTLLMALGLWLAAPALYGFGALVLAHAGFDRALGYGLKSPEGFQFTHLGRIGRGK